MWFKLILICVTLALTSSFDLSGVVNGNRMAGVPLGISQGVGEVDVEGICVQPGMACQNCTHSVTCVPIPGGWLKLPLEDCPSGTTCNAHQGKCSEQPVPECDPISINFEHKCEQVGIFPDAHNCRKFHLCSPPEGLPDGRPADHRVALCPRHYAYNPQTAQCSIPLRNGQCGQRPVPLEYCTEAGMYGPLALSPNYYYVCFLRNGLYKYHPQIFLCPNGWFFYDGYCHPEPQTAPVMPESVNKSVASSESSEEGIAVAVTEPPSTTTTKVQSFFSTDKPVTYPADTFLADKFDLSNYETTDDEAPNTNDEFANSFENGNEFWQQ